MDKYGDKVPHIREIQHPPMEEMTRLVQRIRGILHETLGESAKMEQAIAWNSCIDMVGTLLRKEIHKRVATLLQGKSRDNLPFYLDDTISEDTRSSYMTRVNMEIAKSLKKEYGVDLFEDQGKLLRG